MSRRDHVFAYGSLQLAEVMRAVTGKSFPARPARLEGYARYRLRGRPYPGLRRAPGAATVGVLYGGVDAAALARLDRFEDDFYRRVTLSVTLRTGETVAAEVYIVPPEHDHLLLREPWSLEEFRTAALDEFLGRCRRLR